MAAPDQQPMHVHMHSHMLPKDEHLALTQLSSGTCWIWVKGYSPAHPSTDLPYRVGIAPDADMRMRSSPAWFRPPWTAIMLDTDIIMRPCSSHCFVLGMGTSNTVYTSNLEV